MNTIQRNSKHSCPSQDHTHRDREREGGGGRGEGVGGGGGGGREIPAGRVDWLHLKISQKERSTRDKEEGRKEN